MFLSVMWSESNGFNGVVVFIYWDDYFILDLVFVFWDGELGCRWYR